MANPAQRITSVFPSWAEMEFKLQPYGGGAIQRIVDINEISYSAKLTPGDVPGAGLIKRGTTAGLAAFEASLKLLLEAHSQLVEDLQRVADSYQVSYGQIQFGFFVNWRPKPGQALQRFEFRGARVIEEGFNASPSADASEISTPLNVSNIFKNGVSIATGRK